MWIKPDLSALPRVIDGGVWGGSAGHLQGMAADDENRCFYFSFTDRLVKVDMRTGAVVASVTGLLAGGIYGGGAHLGDLAFWNGRVYGSLEYKAAEKFYIAVFDGDAMTQMDMDYRESGAMRAVYMDEVTRDYTDDLDAGEHDNRPDSLGHRFGCSGIDGITFGRLPGDDSGKIYLLLAYGVYGNARRTDNDNQVLLAFDPEALEPLPFDQNAPHTEGPTPAAKLFLHTGNTTYGVQNLEYDRESGDHWLVCYPGEKAGYPNWPVYVIDGRVPPVRRLVETGGHPCYAGLEGLHLSLRPAGAYHPLSGVWGIPMMPGNADTGFVSLGGDLFYVAESGRLEDGRQFGRAVLCRLDRGNCLFRPVP